MDAGLVTRKDLFVTSKLWNTYHAAEHVLPACKRSLSDLGLEYLDMYLIHFPISLKFVPFETRYPPEWIFDPDSDNPKMEYVSGAMARRYFFTIILYPHTSLNCMVRFYEGTGPGERYMGCDGRTRQRRSLS